MKIDTTVIELTAINKVAEFERELLKLKSEFWRHTHHKHGWEKGRVKVETHEYD